MALAAAVAIVIGIATAVQVQQTLQNTDGVDQNARDLIQLALRLSIAEEHSKLL